MVVAGSVVAGHRTLAVGTVSCLAWLRVAAAHGDSATCLGAAAEVEGADRAPSCPDTWDEDPAVNSPTLDVADVVVKEVAGAEVVVGVDNVGVAGTDTCLR